MPGQDKYTKWLYKSFFFFGDLTPFAIHPDNLPLKINKIDFHNNSSVIQSNESKKRAFEQR